MDKSAGNPICLGKNYVFLEIKYAEKRIKEI
jgi:hypothetical protein